MGPGGRRFESCLPDHDRCLYRGTCFLCLSVVAVLRSAGAVPCRGHGGDVATEGAVLIIWRAADAASSIESPPPECISRILICDGCRVDGAVVISRPLPRCVGHVQGGWTAVFPELGKHFGPRGLIRQGRKEQSRFFEAAVSAANLGVFHIVADDPDRPFKEGVLFYASVPDTFPGGLRKFG